MLGRGTRPAGARGAVSSRRIASSSTLSAGLPSSIQSASASRNAGTPWRPRRAWRRSPRRGRRAGPASAAGRGRRRRAPRAGRRRRGRTGTAGCWWCGSRPHHGVRSRRSRGRCTTTPSSAASRSRTGRMTSTGSSSGRGTPHRRAARAVRRHRPPPGGEDGGGDPLLPGLGAPGSRATPGWSGRAARRRSPGTRPSATPCGRRSARRVTSPWWAGAHWQRRSCPCRPVGRHGPERETHRRSGPGCVPIPGRSPPEGGRIPPRWGRDVGGSVDGHVRSHPRPAQARRRRARPGRHDPRPLRGQGPHASSPWTSARSTRRRSPGTTRSTSARASTTTSSRS